MATRRLVLFARFPVAGKVKTRLIPALGAEGAVALHRRLVLRTFRTACALCRSQNVELEIRSTGGSEKEMKHWLGDGWLWRPQSDGDLGRRMAGAFEDSFREGSSATVIIGSDCPSLTPGMLATAFDSLKTNPVVFGPATDGGYYLVGLTRPTPEIFQDVVWGTDTVLAQSLKILALSDSKPALLTPLDDIDRPEDVAAWKRLAEVDDIDLGRISVIIPALNEGEQITDAITSAQAGKPHEILVVDGGSTDDTIQRACAAGATVIESKRPGRARQMNAGAVCAGGGTLLFLHADTRLPRDYPNAVSEELRQPGVAAAAFRFRIDGNFAGKGILEWTTNLRSRWCQMPYGDQVLFMRRPVFEELGGFADLPIMEDYELNRRLRQRGRVTTSPSAAITSGRRWKKLGVLRTTLINKMMIVGYHLGVCPHKLAKFYPHCPGTECVPRHKTGWWALAAMGSLTLFLLVFLSRADGERQWLYGGDEPGQNFDISKFRLDPAKLHFGLGRERFLALIAPEFGHPGDPGIRVSDNTRILGVVINGEAKAYPIELLRRDHEVINDTVGGRPIFAAYCILANLAGVYDRTMGGHTYTFAVAGYTYADQSIWNGLNAFVLWDRDTESLWLPTIGKAVSGPMIDVPMRLAPKEFWQDTNWGVFHRKHPYAVVLKEGQRMEPPKNFPRFTGPFPSKESVNPALSIAPRGRK